MEQKKSESGFGVKDNCIWIEEGNFSQSQKGYLSFAVKMLWNTSKI